MDPMQDLPFEVLVNQLMIARANETEAFLARTRAEERLLKRIAKTSEGEEQFQVSPTVELHTRTRKLFTVDMERLQELCRRLPDGMRPIRLQAQLDQPFLTHLQRHEIEAWAVIKPAILSQNLHTTLTIKTQ